MIPSLSKTFLYLKKPYLLHDPTELFTFEKQKSMPIERSTHEYLQQLYS
jgi:hypothetical protein